MSCAARPFPSSRRRAAGAPLLAALPLAALPLAALLLAATVPHALPAQGEPAVPHATVLTGVIVDFAGRPLRGVQVVLLEAAASAVTDSAGAFAFAGAPPGWYTLLARRIGYQPATFDIEAREGATTQVRYRLMAVSQLLDTVRVTSAAPRARLRDFEHRRASSLGGTFFTREDIERLDPRELTDLLRRAAGVRIDDAGLQQAVVARRSAGTLVVAARDSALEARPCPFRFALDGRLLPPGTSLNIVAPRDMAGVEVYPGPASIPVEFVRTGPDAVCGLVVVWTR